MTRKRVAITPSSCYIIAIIAGGPAPTPHTPPAIVQAALRKLGADIKDARLRRRLQMADVAERATTSRSTLTRIEDGDTTVGVGIYASVLHVLGLLDGLSQLADLKNDRVGRKLGGDVLPKRVRRKEPRP